MIKRILISMFFVTILILPLSATTILSEKIVTEEEWLTNNNNEQTLKVILNINGSDGDYEINVSMINNGSETVDVTFTRSPLGGFYVYNKINKVVYHAPELFTTPIIELTLQPGQSEKLFDYSGRLPLPGRSYTIKGYAALQGGEIYSEPETITLAKSKSLHSFNFLELFPFLTWLLNLIAN
jgi:hypothetical protein